MTPDTTFLAGANAGRSRLHNRQLVLQQVRRAGRMGRAEIARASGLSTQAVSNIIAELAGEGMLVESGRVSAGRGLPAVQYALNAAGGFALGFEVRPDALFAALLDLEGRAVFSERQALADASPEAVRAAVTTLARRATETASVPWGRLLGAGIVVPGPFGTTGLSDPGSELPGWRHLDVARWFGEEIGLTVLVENDANAAAMAEHVSGVAEGLRHFAFLYFGAGLGLGIVADGKVLRGAFGNAGEIGHVRVPGMDGPVVLEQAVSRVAAQAHLAHAGITARSGEDLAALHAASDPVLMGWLDAAIRPLGEAVALVENLFDPQAVILGGAMPDALLDHLIAGVALSADSVAHRPGRRTPRLLRGASGRMTATLGAAALVLNHAFTPQIALQH